MDVMRISRRLRFSPILIFLLSKLFLTTEEINSSSLKMVQRLSPSQIKCIEKLENHKENIES